MYITPVQFPQFTNREDFLTSIALFDDDTGAPINISGTTLQNPGTSFTSSAWTVTDGAIVTSSATTITIPTPPIGNQLSALTLTVGTGLAIKPADPVIINDTATGLANAMTGFVTGYNSGSGVLTCQIGWTFQFEIRGDTPNSTNGYVPWYDFGTPDDQGPLLIAALGNGITITDIGYLQILIPEATFKGILDVPYNSQSNTYARTFLASMSMTDSVNTRQIFVGDLPVLYGGVTN